MVPINKALPGIHLQKPTLIGRIQIGINLNTPKKLLFPPNELILLHLFLSNLLNKLLILIVFGDGLDGDESVLVLGGLSVIF
jgi:hypothetical protein